MGSYFGYAVRIGLPSQLQKPSAGIIRQSQIYRFNLTLRADVYCERLQFFSSEELVKMLSYISITVFSRTVIQA